MRTVSIYQFDHESGSKTYHLIKLEDSETGQGQIIRRWGKRCANGQVKYGHKQSAPKARQELALETAKRVKRDYKEAGQVRLTFLEELQAGKPATELSDIVFMSQYNDPLNSYLREWLMENDTNDIIDTPVLDETIDRGDLWGSW